MDDSTSEFIRDKQALGAKIRQYEDLEKLNRKEVAAWSDIDLAGWQGQYPIGSPQHFLAEHEWQRRITAQQIRAGYRAAILSGIMGLAGVVLGWLLSEATKHYSDQRAEAQHKAASATINSPPKPVLASPAVQPLVTPKKP